MITKKANANYHCAVWHKTIYEYLATTFTLQKDNNVYNKKQCTFLSKFMAQELYSMKCNSSFYENEEKHINVLKNNYYIRKSLSLPFLTFKNEKIFPSFINLITKSCSDKQCYDNFSPEIQLWIRQWQREMEASGSLSTNAIIFNRSDNTIISQSDFFHLIETGFDKNELSLSDPDNKKIIIAYLSYTLQIYRKKNSTTEEPEDNEDNNSYMPLFEVLQDRNNKDVKSVDKNFYSVFSNRKRIIEALYETKKFDKHLKDNRRVHNWHMVINEYFKRDFTLRINDIPCSEKQIEFLSKFIGQELYAMKIVHSLYEAEINQIDNLKIDYYAQKSMNRNSIPKVFDTSRTYDSFCNMIYQSNISSIKDLNSSIINIIKHWKDQIKMYYPERLQSI